MAVNKNVLWIGLLAAAGCVEGGDPASTEGNSALGIARFDVQDTSVQTTVVGLDARGNERARMVLLHGQFTLSPAFSPDEQPRVVDGRKLDVSVFGHVALTYETPTFVPIMELPPHPPSEWALATFLDDPHVKAVLDHWQLGFQPFHGGEAAYATGGISPGFDPQSCTGVTSCGIGYLGQTVNTCGGGQYAPSSAWKVSTYERRDYIHRQVLLAQCCPASSGGQSVPWFGVKACPLDTNDSYCGPATGACVACPAYPVATQSQCTVNVSYVGYIDSMSSFQPRYENAYSLNWSYAEPTGSVCGNGVCEDGESCDICGDCGSCGGCTEDGGYAPAGYGADPTCCSGYACEYSCGNAC